MTNWWQQENKIYTLMKTN